MSDSAIPAVTHDAGAGQFEMLTPAGTALLRYVAREDALDLVHTQVPAELEGKGYGTALVEAAVAYATREGIRIVPTCPFVRHFIDTHPEHASLVAKAGTPRPGTV